jgi:hypothetical protein
MLLVGKHCQAWLTGAEWWQVVGEFNVTDCTDGVTPWCRVHATGGAYGRITAFNATHLRYEHVQNNGGAVTDTWTIVQVSAARARPYVATPLGAQRARPSLQLSESEIVALVGCHANHVVRRQHHCQRCKRGQLLPRMLCGSTTAFRFGGLPCESRGSQVVPPDAVGPDEP